MRLAHTVAILLVLVRSAPGGPHDTSRFAKWSTIEVDFTGPASIGGGEPNPFAIRLDVTFTSPSGRLVVVPGFYDGDGRGGENGDVWRVRFSADELGEWRFTTASDHRTLDGKSGRLLVAGTADRAEGFRKWGRLEAVGTAENRIRYLKFRDGPYWLKAGCDDPENFLGSYHHFHTLAQRKAAVDYLASKGINSLYIMTHNIGGDDNDVWPWRGYTPAAAKKNATAGNVRFDIEKLTEWRVLFEYMQYRGVVPYLVLEDDSAWTGYDHARYYRELIARFGDLPALLFNMGEENNENYSLDAGLALAALFRKLDPYGHPLGIHNMNRPNDRYIDSPNVDFTSIQTGSPGRRSGPRAAVEHNAIAAEWIARCLSRGRRVLMVNFDEGRPEHDRRAWWSAYLGGGVWEAHVAGPYDQPHHKWEITWKELGGARTFMESLPFERMLPQNEVVKTGTAFCLAEPTVAYALYLPAGGAIRIALPAGQRYRCDWWNPNNGSGGRFQNEQTIGGGLQRLSAPGAGDWALRIVSIPAP